MTGDITLYSVGGKITFGREGFVLHQIESTPPKILPTGMGSRCVTIRGYILPEGEDEGGRAASLDVLSRRVMRLVTAAEGFYLEERGRTLHLVAESAPDFSREAPFAEGDAACFTVRALSEEESPYYTESPREITARGMDRKLVFPLIHTPRTVFATLSQSGVVNLPNPGDVPCGFTAVLEVEKDTVASLTVRLGEKYITVCHPLSPGESITVCTEPGKKNVYLDGESILSSVDWGSTFFSLSPGDNSLEWHTEGDGCPRLHIRFTPLYL